MANPGSAAPGMPPFVEVLKSREVEDPVNLWVHRPLAYAFCHLIYRTPITPNHVTVLATVLGLAAAACWFDGGRGAMIWGGALLWSSAIMDGADGILARAKNLQSAFGRALDGMADWTVALSSTAACLYHMYVTGTGRAMLLLSGAAIATTIVQLNSYDLYKEIHVYMTRLDKEREGHSPLEIARLRQSQAVREGAWYTRLSMMFYADYVRSQGRIVAATNPSAGRLLFGVTRSAASAEIYRQHNRLSMRVWMALSMAPHCYLFAIFGMLDRLDLYLLLRLTVMNGIMVVAFLLQRRATARTLSEFEERGWLEAGHCVPSH